MYYVHVQIPGLGFFMAYVDSEMADAVDELHAFELSSRRSRSLIKHILAPCSTAHGDTLEEK
mgnify:CR=1 FL=1